MPTCPLCRIELVRVHLRGTVLWSCPECGGRALAATLIARTVDARRLSAFWRNVRASAERAERPCPMCARAMSAAVLEANEGKLTLDGCTSCLFVWLDPDEVESVRVAAKAGPERARPELAPSAADAVGHFLAAHQAELARIRADARAPRGPGALLGWLGVPLPEDTEPLPAVPVSTLALLVAIGVASAAAFTLPFEERLRFGFSPAEPLRFAGATLVTYVFVHAGIVNLIVNLAALWVFGREVERLLGSLRAALFFVVCTLCASVGYALLARDPDAPLVGAGSLVSGMAVFFAVSLPAARIKILVVVLPLFRWITLRASTALWLWLVLLLLGNFSAPHGVARVAQVGGAPAGLVAGLLWRRRGQGADRSRARAT